MNKRKLLTLALTLCMVAILAIGGTLAYFTDVESASNQITVGDIDIALNEDFDDEDPLVPSEDPANNYVKKEVDIENKGKSDAYVRLLIAYEDTQDVGAMAWMGFNTPYAMKGVQHSDTEDNYVIPSNGSDWLQIKDSNGTVYTVGYVTISTALKPGEKTPEILKGVAIKAGADNAWAQIVDEKYDVLVLAQGAQVIDDKGATYSLDTSYGFAMGYNDEADAKVAELFTKAGLGTFTAHKYTSENAWAPKTAWNAFVTDPTPDPDVIGVTTDSND